MKSSVHLFYGIIIGILLVACTGSLKEDKAEFKQEMISGGWDWADIPEKGLKKHFEDTGWTIIDWEIHPDGKHYFHVGG